MRLLRLQSSLNTALPSAVFAALWLLERRARERAERALAELKDSLEQQICERTTELTAANAQLREVNYLQSKFIADAAHELRAPLNTLKLRVHLLENGKPERQAHYLAELKAQIDRLAALSEDLLNIARLEEARASQHFAPLDLNTVVEQVVIAYRPLAESAGLSLIFEAASDLPLVLGQRSQLAQVGSNLVGNAIQYTPAGEVHVITTLAADLRRVCMIVQDTGIGIAPEDLPHLFDRFYRGRQAEGMNVPGSGLGLNIVKEIVDRHGGTIEVESTVGVGSTFKICLPLAPATV
jgi:signal transduction histidine kinase